MGKAATRSLTAESNYSRTAFVRLSAMFSGSIACENHYSLRINPFSPLRILHSGDNGSNHVRELFVPLLEDLGLTDGGVLVRATMGAGRTTASVFHWRIFRRHVLYQQANERRVNERRVNERCIGD